MASNITPTKVAREVVDAEEPSLDATRSSTANARDNDENGKNGDNGATSEKLGEERSEAAVELATDMKTKSTEGSVETSSVHGQTVAKSDTVSSKPSTLLINGQYGNHTSNAKNNKSDLNCYSYELAASLDSINDQMRKECHEYLYNLRREQVYGRSIKQSTQRDLTFLDRVSGLPFVTSSLEVYQQAKRNNLLSLPLSLMEFGAAVSAFPFVLVASPVLYSCSAPVAAANWVLCKGLDVAETVFPCIAAPPDQMCRMIKESATNCVCCCPRVVKHGVNAVCQKLNPV